MSIFYLLIISIVINLAFFAVAFSLKSDKFTDGTYALTFFSLALIALLTSDARSSLSYVAFIMVCLWAARIGVFLVGRIRKIGKDSRFDDMRDSLLKFGRFWVGQAITAWIVMIPAVLVINSGGKIELVSWLGVLIWAVGLIIETIADWQKSKFRSIPQNKDKWISNGLWRYSRHPNYFGEILAWVGLYIVALPSLEGATQILALVSPLFITYILLFVTGVPILEKLADGKWGGDSAYIDYKKRTSVLILLPNFKDK